MIESRMQSWAACENQRFRLQQVTRRRPSCVRLRQKCGAWLLWQNDRTLASVSSRPIFAMALSNASCDSSWSASR